MTAVQKGVSITHFLAGIAGGLSLLGGPSLLWAQGPDPYPFILNAVRNSLSAPRFYAEVTGWERTGNNPTRQYLMRCWYEGGKLLVEAYEDAKIRLLLVNDGRYVWRYDPVANEYTFLPQGSTFQEVIGTIVAWSRKEMQRPMRLLALSPRWLTAPSSNVQPTYVEVWQSTGQGNSWRGTSLRFDFDAPHPAGKMDKLYIYERYDITGGGTREGEFTMTFSYPANSFGIPFTFVPPPGSRPAADLPRRIP